MSKFLPNSYQVPNWYTDRYQGLLHPNEWSILTYAMRRIFGFQKRSDRISLSQFSGGIWNKDGERLDFGTGLSEATCRKYLKRLQEYNLVIEVKTNDPKKNEGILWSLQLDSDRVNDEAILEAFDGRNKQSGERTKAGLEAIKAYWRKQKGGNVAREDLTSDETTPITSDVTTVLTSDDTHNIQEKTSRNTDASPNGEVNENSSSTRKRSAHDIIRKRLEEAFQEITNRIPPTNGKALNTEWHTPLKEMYNWHYPKGDGPWKYDEQAMKDTINLIEAAFKEMKSPRPGMSNGLAVYSPKSILKTAQDIFADGLCDATSSVPASEWLSVKAAAGQPGRPDISERALKAINLMPGGWSTIKSCNMQRIDLLKPAFEEAYERANSSPAQ